MQKKHVQEQVLEKCTENIRQEMGEITPDDISKEDTQKLKTTAEKIEKIREKIECGSISRVE